MATNSSASVLKIFISSTYEDMIPYREAATQAIMSLEHLPIGMEHFVSSPEKSLDVCLSDVRRCNLYVLLIGMRYGSVDINSGKSYTELEYEEAVRNNIPVLAFVIDENECPVIPKFFDSGENAQKLISFKNRLNESHMTSRFKSVDDLKQLIIRAVETQVKKAIEKETKRSEEISNKDKYMKGAEIFRRFTLLPERYKNQEVYLRVRIDGHFGCWKQRDALFEAYDLPPGDTLRMADAFVLGIDFYDIDSTANRMDLYAEGKNADWILDSSVSRGSIIEGKFKLLYETVENITSSGDAKVAVLLMVEGCSTTNKKRKNPI